MTHLAAPLYLGGVPITGGSMPITTGNIFYVNYGTGSDGNTGTSPKTPLKTINRAYALCTSNAMDVIVLLGNSTHVLSAPIAWSKSRITVIGGDLTPRLVQQNAKIQCATTGAVSYVIKNTGTRNWFHNIKFIQDSTEATALTVLEEGAEGSCYTNCSFLFGVADNLDQTNAYEVLAGSDSATFIDCLFGSDVLVTSAARTVFRIDQVTASQEFKSNMLRNCTFMVQTSSADVKFVSGAATSDIKFTNIFDSCTFCATINQTNSAIAVTSAVTTPNGLVEGGLYFAYPRCYNVTDFGTNGTNNDNLLVVAPLNVATDIVGVAPVAT